MTDYLTLAAADHLLLLASLRSKRAYDDNSSLTTTTTGALLGEQVLDIINADTLLPRVMDPGAPPTHYMIAVRKLRTNEQFMLPTPVASLARWFDHFRDYPIFNGIDFLSPTLAFPDLSAPVASAFETKKFHIHNEFFAVTVTKTAPTAASLPSLDMDTVHVHLATPPLPTKHATFVETMGRSSHLRRACMTHIGAIALVQQYGFSKDDTVDSAPAAPPPDTYGDRALMYGDNDALQSRRLPARRFHGTFVTSRVERNTGADVIPLVLQHLHSLLPLIDAKQAIEYDIVQPHRYAYAFQLRSVGGWRVLGAVNFYASHEELSALFPTPEPGLHVVRPLAPLPAANSAVYERLRERVTATMRAVETTFKTAMATWKPTPPTLKKPWIGGDGAFQIRATTGEADKLALPQGAWSRLTAYMGLLYVQTLIAQQALSAERQLQTERGERFLNAWLAPADAPPIAGIDIAHVLFELARGLATIAIVQHTNPMPRDTSARALRDKLMAPNAEVLPIDLSQLAAAAQKLRGTPPSKWAVQIVMLFFSFRAIELAQLLLTDPSVYEAVLLPLLQNSTLLDKTAAKLPAYLKNTKAFAPSIQRAYLAARKCRATALDVSTDEKRETLTDALAYALFTHNAEYGVDVWA